MLLVPDHQEVLAGALMKKGMKLPVRGRVPTAPSAGRCPDEEGNETYPPGSFRWRSVLAGALMKKGMKRPFPGLHGRNCCAGRCPDEEGNETQAAAWRGCQ